MENNEIKLPKFIYQAIVKKYTSLGDNPAFPPIGDFGFEYDVIREAYINARQELEEATDVDPDDIDSLESELGKIISVCKRIEEPLKPKLEALCSNMVNYMLSIPEDTIDFACSLTNKVTPKRSIRVMPESSANDAGLFDDTDDIEYASKEVAKRRFVDSLIQGAAKDVEDAAYESFIDEINELDASLLGLWGKIRRINDYLVFVKKVRLSDKNPMQVSYVEVALGHNGDKTRINAQGIIYPYMLREAFKGFFELFSSHGLPEDNKKAMYIIRKADFIAAEPWDMRFGYTLWKKIMSTADSIDVKAYPYAFSKICELDVEDFNFMMKNVLANTNKGRDIMQSLSDEVLDDYDYQQFADSIRKRSVDKAVISDDCFSSDELGDYVIENIY